MRRAVVMDGVEHQVVLVGPAPVQHRDAGPGAGRDRLHRQPDEADRDQFLPRGLQQGGLKLLPASPLAGPLPLRLLRHASQHTARTVDKRGLHSLTTHPILHKRRIHLLWRRGVMATTTSKPAADKLDPEVVKTALILIVGVMAVIFDTTIVSVALHTLALKLDTSVDDDPVGDHRLPAGTRHRGAAQHLGPAAVRRQAAVDVLPRRVPDRLDRRPAWRGTSARSSAGGSSRASAAASCSR